MRKISQEELIKEHWENQKSKYPHLEYEDFRVICRAPFEFIKELIAGKQFVRILVKYLGIFTVFPGRIITLLQHNIRSRTKGYIDQEEYMRKRDYFLKIFNEVKYDYLDDDQEDTEESPTD